MNESEIQDIIFKLHQCELLASKYKKLLGFVKELADESVYEKYENENEINWAAFELLQEIGEK